MHNTRRLKTGRERKLITLIFPEAEIADVVDRFLAIGDSPETFKAFVNGAAESTALRGA